MARTVVAAFHRFQHEMARTEPEVHRRIAEMGRLVIDEREAIAVRQDRRTAALAVRPGAGLGLRYRAVGTEPAVAAILSSSGLQ